MKEQVYKCRISVADEREIIEGNYLSLLSALAIGVEVAPEEIESICKATGRTVEQFRDDLRDAYEDAGKTV